MLQINFFIEMLCAIIIIVYHFYYSKYFAYITTRFNQIEMDQKRNEKTFKKHIYANFSIFHFRFSVITKRIHI